MQCIISIAYFKVYFRFSIQDDKGEFTYTYNPCYSFSSEPCTGVAVSLMPHIVNTVEVYLLYGVLCRCARLVPLVAVQLQLKMV